ncbi:hypothetical protein MYXO_00791 [Myxococcaceae bacterium]|nr:hypothetical protein MYXO_00791 [Myxococcaceae bacterium]
MRIEARFSKAVALAAAIATTLPVFVLAAGPFVGERLATHVWIVSFMLVHASLVAARAIAAGKGARARSLAIDLVLGLVGVALAGWLVRPGLAGHALAVWGFALVQSLRLLADAKPRAPESASADRAFEDSCARAQEILEFP